MGVGSKRWVEIKNDAIQEFSRLNVKRQEFRLKVTNKGFGTAKRVKAIIELFNMNKEEEERFEPNCLRWVSTRESRDIDIAGGETTYVYLLSHIIEILPPDDKKPLGNNFFVIRLELFDLITPRGLAWDKNNESYYLKVIIHGDNVKAKTQWFKYVHDEEDILRPGELIQI